MVGWHRQVRCSVLRCAIPANPGATGTNASSVAIIFCTLGNWSLERTRVQEAVADNSACPSWRSGWPRTSCSFSDQLGDSIMQFDVRMELVSNQGDPVRCSRWRVRLIVRYSNAGIVGGSTSFFLCCSCFDAKRRMEKDCYLPRSVFVPRTSGVVGGCALRALYDR